jgi:hypothetical protein
MAKLPKLTGPQWTALEAVKARHPDAGPKPRHVHRSTLAKLVAMGLLVEVRREAPLGRPEPRPMWARTLDGQAALNRLQHERLGLHRAQQLALPGVA